MMRVVVNGETRDTAVATVAGLWSSETAALAPPSRRGFAIALNGALVRAPDWDTTTLQDGDRIEIVRAVGGG